MKKFLKILLIVLILAILAGLDIWLILKKGWQWWIGVAMYAGVIGVWISFLFLKKYLTRRKERKFVHRVVELDEAAIKRSAVHERQELKDLQVRWKESVDLLRASNIKRGISDPIYAIPWYIIIGESGAGKTTAIKNAKLNSPVSDITRTAGLAATENCDWWFLDNAIILDTAGRYTIPVDESADKEEWEELLVLLAKYRRREPVNGLIVTVSAEKLLFADPMTLRADGQSIRKRIDQLMRVSGAKFPVYFLVTKMDMVYGFADTFLKLPSDDTNQTAGYLNSDEHAGWEKIVEQTFAVTGERLHEIRTGIIESSADNPDPGTLIFLQEFMSLKTALKEFTKSVFEENPYQETPILRGIYFSSARQDSESHSRFLEMAGQPAVGESGKTLSRGLFLQDFFGQILPMDRYFMRPVYEFIKWRRLTGSLGFLSIVFIFIALTGLLTASFFHNVRALGNFVTVFKTRPVLEKNLTNDILMLEKFRIQISEVHESNRRWFLPSFGLTAANDFEKKAKDYYVKLYREGFLLNFDGDLYRNVNKISAATDSDTIAVYAEFLIARIYFVKYYLEHGGFFRREKEFEGMDDFRRTFTNIMAFMYPQVPSPVAATAADTYKACLDLDHNKADLSRTLELLQAALNDILKKHKDLKWLVKQSMLNVYTIYLDDFWTKSGEREAKSPITIPGEYTKDGQKKLKQFMESMEKAGAKEKPKDVTVKNFWEWYRTQYINAWQQFAVNFNKGDSFVKSETDRNSMAMAMTTDQNPYWIFLKKAAAELSQDDYLTNPPQWAQLVVEFDEARKISVQDDKKAKKDVKTKLLDEEKKVVQDLERFQPKAGANLDRRIAAGNVYVELNKTMGQIAPIATSNENCYRLTAELFTDLAAATESKSPFNIAFVQYYNLKNTLKDFKDNTEFVWKLVGGPINYLLTYGTKKASCTIQNQWEQDVVGKAGGVSKDKLPKLLFDKKDGVVWKFRDGPAKPFLAAGKWGYTSRKIYETTPFEHTVGFQPDFLGFINRGESALVAYQPEYIVNIGTIPISVNDEASVKPLAVTLSVQCADSEGVVKNYNYKDKGILRWSPEKCGDTSLMIQLPNLTINKIYKGQMGFPKFLSDFRTGARIFNAEEFPDAKDALANISVKWIKIQYKIEHALPVIDLLKGTSPKIPSVITRCESENKTSASSR